MNYILIIIPLEIVAYWNQSILGQVRTHTQIEDFKTSILSNVSVNDKYKWMDGWMDGLADGRTNEYMLNK